MLFLFESGSASAAGRLEGQWSFGARDFVSHRLGWSVALSTSWMVGTGYGVFDGPEFPSAVGSVRGGFQKTLEDGIWRGKLLYYPKTRRAQTLGLESAWLHAFGDEENSFQGTVGLSWIRHFPSLNQGGAQIQVARSFTRDFAFSGSLSGFVYDQSRGPRGRVQTFFNQNDVVFLGTLGAVTRFPTWNWDLGFSRRLAPLSDWDFFVSYHESHFSQVPGSANAVLTGFHGRLLDLLEGAEFTLAYSWLNPAGEGSQSHYALFLSYGW
ncbi:MAG: hypothetical protein HY402_03135 [Elusimicrobia bacterium]|nr:hypothetical protein [Elusimicrobiota bacterium]